MWGGGMGVETDTIRAAWGWNAHCDLSFEREPATRGHVHAMRYHVTTASCDGN